MTGKSEFRLADFVEFIQERYNIYAKRQNGLPKPWTADPILRAYRFCNTHREHDTVTEWIRDNWRQPFQKNPDLYFALVVARLVNWPETMEELGFPVPFNKEHFISIINERKSRGEKAFSGAYIVSTNGVKANKANYLANKVLQPLWLRRENLRPTSDDLLETYHAKLSSFNGLGSFLAAQVIADIKYVTPLCHAKDWWSFAASGPGSRRGMNRMLGRSIDSPWNEQVWRRYNDELTNLVQALLRKCKSPIPPLHAQDVQNCLCEFDKYERTRLGEGRPRSTYPGV